MSGSSERGDRPAILDFNDWIRNQVQTSCDLTQGKHDPNKRFVPGGVVEKYLQSTNYVRTKNLLRDLFPGQEPPVSAANVADHCPRIFCILIQLNKGKYITSFARHNQLRDHRLPFDEKAPRHFPVVPEDDGFYEKFYRRQWQYCAPKFEPGSDVRYSDDDILPILNMERKGDGRSASVYRVQVHAAHNELAKPSMGSGHRDVGTAGQAKQPPATNFFALKTFKTSTADQDFKRESEAFRQVTESGEMATVGLIAFHMSFLHLDTWNILLEYADGGSLEEFWQQNNAPGSGGALVDYWEELFMLTKGLFTIHHHYLEADSHGLGALLQGWHHDLKPDNVLVFRSESAYGWTFKIADLGLSSFKAVTESQAEAADKYRFGTRAYGPPECCARSTFTEMSINPVKRSIDIWALGCIYSEAAVWGLLGSAGLVQYRDQRKQETDRLRTQLNFQGGIHCFHNGLETLASVNDKHIELKELFRDHNDFISGRVLDNMVTEMLFKVAAARPSAQTLVVKAENEIKSARGGLKRHSASPGSPGSSTLPSPTQGTRWLPRHGDTTNGSPPPFTISPRNTMTIDSSRSIAPQMLAASGKGKQPAFDPFVEILRNESGDNPQPPVHHPVNDQLLQQMDRGVRLDDGPHATDGALRLRTVACTVKQAKDWYDKRKYGHKTAELPRHGLGSSLEGRDHVFIIDDSHTMKDYWLIEDGVRDTAKLLTYITKTKDTDGLDLYFLSSEKKYKISDASAMVKKIKHHTPKAETSLYAGAFDHDLRSYAQQVGSWFATQGRYGQASLTKRSVYVLTDGAWKAGEDDQGHETIRLLVDKLKRAGFDRNQIGIQFISFGNNQRGLHRLAELDRLKQSQQLPLDIVDTEPSNGDVWKMLLGAINPMFDDD